MTCVFISIGYVNVRVELLGHVVTLCLIIWWTARMFSKVADKLYTNHCILCHWWSQEKVPTSCITCSFLAMCMCSVMSDFATPWAVACQAPLSMGILQTRILEWVVISFSMVSSWLRDWTCVSCSCCIGSGFFTTRAPWEAPFLPGKEIIGWKSLLCSQPEDLGYVLALPFIICVWLCVIHLQWVQFPCHCLETKRIELPVT